MTSYVNQDEGTSFRQEPVTSTDGTFASDVAGLDFEQLKLFCSILDIPGPPESYDTVNQRVIHSTLLKHTENRLAATNDLKTFNSTM